MNKSIKIDIAGRMYPLSVTSPEEENKLLQLADEINQTLTRLKKSYAIKDNQDLLSMAILEMGSVVKEEKVNPHEAQMDEQILRLEKMSGELLRSV
jgi:cell division protein ZapA (FtsZ GTPase activity inhibitor)